MEHRETPPDISEVIARIAEKLKNKQKITIKTPTNPITQGFLLSQIIIHSDLPKSCILFLVKDDIAKLGIITSIKHWTKNEKKMPIHSTLSTAALADIKDNKACLVILTQEEAKQNLPSKKTFEAHTINLKKAQRHSKEHLLKQLVDSGYTLERIAQEPGIASSRGSIVDICAPDSENITRVDFDDEIIDNIKTISQSKKRETKEVAAIRIIPYSLDHLEATTQLNGYNPKIKHIICDPFPREYDIQACFTSKDAQILSQLSAPEHSVRAKHALPSFIKNLQNSLYHLCLLFIKQSFMKIVLALLRNSILSLKLHLSVRIIHFFPKKSMIKSLAVFVSSILLIVALKAEAS